MKARKMMAIIFQAVKKWKIYDEGNTHKIKKGPR